MVKRTDTPKRKSRAKPLADAVWTDPILLRHQIVNSRALLRRRKSPIHPMLRERLERTLPLLEARAVELGIAPVTGWRQYPDTSHGLVFTASVDLAGPAIEQSPPAEVQRRRKPRTGEDEPAAKDAGAMLDDTLVRLERSIAAIKREGHCDQQ